MIEKNCQLLNEQNGISKGKASYKLKEIIAILGISPSTARNLIKENKFRSVRIGREVRIIKADFDAWLENESKEGKHYGIVSKKKK